MVSRSDLHDQTPPDLGDPVRDLSTPAKYSSHTSAPALDARPQHGSSWRDRRPGVMASRPRLPGSTARETMPALALTAKMASLSVSSPSPSVPLPMSRPTSRSVAIRWPATEAMASPRATPATSAMEATPRATSSPTSAASLSIAIPAPARITQPAATRALMIGSLAIDAAFNILDLAKVRQQRLVDRCIQVLPAKDRHRLR